MTADADYVWWVKLNPPPSLNELIKKYGSYSNIPPEAMRDYDARMSDWHYRRAHRLVGEK
jgi:hypothetical protein